MRSSTPLLIFLLIGFVVLSCDSKSDKEEKNSGNNPPDTSTTINRKPGINPYAIVDVSPMDMSYYPVDYPKLKMSKTVTEPPMARVIYSRPHLQGRRLFQNMLKHGQPWRLGANESTELELYKDATIQDKKVKAGRYVLYSIPQPDHWTIILNSNTDSWGLEPDTTKDVFRFSAPVTQTGRNLEYFTMVFEKKGEIIELVMAWEDIETRLPIRW